MRYELNLSLYFRMALLSNPVPWLRRVVDRLLTAEARLQSEVSSCEICVGLSDSGTGSSGSTSVFPCQYHSTILNVATRFSYHNDTR